MAAQIEKMRTDDEELGLPWGMIRTKGHQLWFLEHLELLIYSWATAGVQVTELGVWMLTLTQAEPTFMLLHCCSAPSLNFIIMEIRYHLMICKRNGDSISILSYSLGLMNTHCIQCTELPCSPRVRPRSHVMQFYLVEE